MNETTNEWLDFSEEIIGEISQKIRLKSELLGSRSNEQKQMK